MTAEIELEERDTVVLRHALRLGVLEGLTRKRETTGIFVVSTIVADGKLLRLFVAITGEESGDNGHVMMTVPNRPGFLTLLQGCAMSAYSSKPTIERTPSPCRN